MMSSDQAGLPQGEGEDLPRFLESKPLRAKQAAKPPQKKQWILLSLLSLVLIVLVFQTFFGGKKKPVRLAAQKSATVASVVQTDAVVTAENDIFQAVGQGESRSSPFKRLSSGPGAPIQGPAPLVLQGVLSDANGSTYAVINEKIVKKGERMADKVVTTIQSDSVTLRGDSGEEVTLRMKA